MANKKIKSKTHGKYKHDKDAVKKNVRQKGKKQQWIELSKNKIFIIGMVLGAVALALVLYSLSQPILFKLSSKAEDVKNNANMVKELKSDKMFIYVFGDYECPFTKKIADSYERLLKEYKDRIEIFYMHLPLPSHPNAMDAAIAAECVKKIDSSKYDQYNIRILKENSLKKETYLKIVKELNINEAEFLRCYENKETQDIVERDLELASRLGISGTPTWIIGENVIAGAISYESLKNIVEDNLKQFNGTNIDITKTETVKGIILYAKECEECKNDMLIPLIKEAFGFADFEVYEINDAKGKEIIKKLNIEFVPAILISSKVENSFFWKANKDQLRLAFEPLGEWYRFRFENTGFQIYYIDPEKRAKLEEERRKLFNLDPNKPQIDFFIMSFCPFGNIAEEAIAEVYNLLKNYAKFIPHYIYYPEPTGSSDRCLFDKENNIYYCALHGIKELEQDVRELCVYNLYNEEKYFEFIKIVNKDCSLINIDGCWKTAAEKAKIDVSTIEKCYNENKLNYVRAQVEKTQKLGVRGSPTVYINGKLYKGPRTPEAYKQALCSEMKDKPSVCNVQLSSTQQQATGSCG